MSILNDPTIRFLEKAVDYRVARQEVVASNVANTETPGYIAKEVPFESFLSRAESGNSVAPVATHPHHFGISQGTLSTVAPVESEGDSVRVDGNNVVMEKEMTKLAENSVGYMTAMTLIARKMRFLRTAIEDSARI